MICIGTMQMYINTNKHISNFTLLAQTSNVETSYQLKDWLLFSKQKLKVFTKPFLGGRINLEV